MPKWQPGQSGNPGGRAKGAERLAREAAESRRYTDANGNEHTGFAALMHCLIDIAFNADEGARERIAAANSAMDRGWGKPKQSLEISGELGDGTTPTQLDPSSMTDEEIKAGLDAIETLKRLGAAADGDAPTEH